MWGTEIAAGRRFVEGALIGDEAGRIADGAAVDTLLLLWSGEEEVANEDDDEEEAAAAFWLTKSRLSVDEHRRGRLPARSIAVRFASPS